MRSEEVPEAQQQKLERDGIVIWPTSRQSMESPRGTMNGPLSDHKPVAATPETARALELTLKLNVEQNMMMWCTSFYVV